MPSSLNCEVCGGTRSRREVDAREMMIGTREVFRYWECADCGCVQIVEIPRNLGQYYRDGYYSLVRRAPRTLSRWKRAYKRAQFAALAHLPVAPKSRLGKALGMKEFFPWLARAGAGPDSRILDVGSGSGSLLLEIAEFGFHHLTGVDPHLPEPITYPGVEIRRAELRELRDRYDLVMAQHSFEHMPGQLEKLRLLGGLLSEGGVALIRIPIAAEAWERYGANWAALDPPRHLYLHSERSFRLLCERAGLQVEHVEFDSDGFQFWGSEQIARDIPLNDPRSHAVNSQNGLFTERELDEYARRARELNRGRRGDCAAFYLRRA